jgi:hypothetical protein
MLKADIFEVGEFLLVSQLRRKKAHNGNSVRLLSRLFLCKPKVCIGNRKCMVDEQCSECTRLEAAVTSALEHISTITNQQLKAVRQSDQEAITRLDKELETAIGEKERAMGVLLYHKREHRH